MKIGLINELRNSKETYIADNANNSSYIINQAAENKEEYIFLIQLKEVIKKEMFSELDKQIDNFKFFASR